MTVATQTRSWQSNPVGGAGDPIQPPAAPSLFPLLEWLCDVHGGESLSAPDLWTDRPVRGGTAVSSHRGAAFDWRYNNPGPGRDYMLTRVLPFLLNFSYELNIQQVHDYWGCRVWKASRVVGGNPDTGWLHQTPGSHSGMMGQSWAAWLHIEAGTWGWYDGRSVTERVGGAGGDDELMATANDVWQEKAPNLITGGEDRMWAFLIGAHEAAYKAMEATRDIPAIVDKEVNEAVRYLVEDPDGQAKLGAVVRTAVAAEVRAALREFAQAFRA